MAVVSQNPGTDPKVPDFFELNADWDRNRDVVDPICNWLGGYVSGTMYRTSMDLFFSMNKLHMRCRDARYKSMRDYRTALLGTGRVSRTPADKPYITPDFAANINTSLIYFVTDDQEFWRDTQEQMETVWAQQQYAKANDLVFKYG